MFRLASKLMERFSDERDVSDDMTMISGLRNEQMIPELSAATL